MTLSLAGRTASPAPQPVPVRIGGFGGAEGLAEYLKAEHIDALIDATHPYAAIIAANAAKAAFATNVPLLALRRAPWVPVTGDRWIAADTLREAIAKIGGEPRRVFLALGRKDLAAFEAAPQHDYLIRSVDPVDPPLKLPRAQYIESRGPFTEANDRALMERHRTEVVVAKNSGGESTYGKIAGARALGIDVVMLRRPSLPHVTSVESIDDAVRWIDHRAAPGAERGV